MGFYKNDSDGRKSSLFPADGDNNDDILWATEKGLVTKAGGCGNPDADPEVLVCQGGLDDTWGTAHLVGFEWKKEIRSKDKDFMNSEATTEANNYGGSGQYVDRVGVYDYSYNTGDWRGMLLACTAHFSEPVWVTGTNNVSPRLKVTSNLGSPGTTIYLPWKNTDLYASDYVDDVPDYNGATSYDGTLSSISITNGGSGYTSPPEISFSDQGNPQATVVAQAYAQINDGAVTGIVLYNKGNGYNAIPNVVFDNTGTGGSSAAATAIRINYGDGSQGMTHSQYRNQYLYSNGSSSVTFAIENPIGELPFPLGLSWGTGSAFSIPENAIDLNTSGTIKEGTSAGGTNAVITNSASRSSGAGGVTVFHQLGEVWVNF